jgi:IS30 family transposase
MALGRPKLPRELERKFWRLVRSGRNYDQASDEIGVSLGVATRWVRQGGGMPMVGLAEPTGRYLSLAEREEIAAGRAAKLGVREIARQIGRSPSTVSREIWRHRGDSCGPYRASVAQARADEAARRPKPAKLARNDRLRQEVEDKLIQRWSPRQISERLEIDFPDDEGMRISHEAIYQALYVQGRGGLRRELAKCLRTGRALRRPQRRADRRRSRIPDKVMISERPAEADDRAVPGHWEGDLITGASNKTAIGTLVERATRYTMLLHLPDGHGAKEVEDAMVATMSTLPDHLRRSLTWDQGAEMTNHAAITIAADLPIYFCDPHSPWQRGSNENTNGLLRQYFPKGTDLSIHSAETLARVAVELNGRPRETLAWRTPAEALNALLSRP